MMNWLGHEQENVTKNIRNLFELKKENQVIKDRIIRYIRNLFEHEEEKDCCKPVRVGNFWRNSYIDHESNNDKNKTQSTEELLNKSLDHN